MRRRPALALLLLPALAAPACLTACASKPRQSGEVLRIDEIAAREREGYAIARRAAEAHRNGNTELAIDLYRQALGTWPEIASAWNNLGLLQMGQSNYMEAVESFKAAARLDPTDPRPLINVGVAYDQTGWAEDALTAYLQALERRPNDRDALLGAITANHRLLGASRPALDRVKAALMIEPDDQVRAWLERERFRIESRLASTAEAESIRIPAPYSPPSQAAPQVPAAVPVVPRN